MKDWLSKSMFFTGITTGMLLVYFFVLSFWGGSMFVSPFPYYVNIGALALGIALLYISITYLIRKKYPKHLLIAKIVLNTFVMLILGSAIVYSLMSLYGGIDNTTVIRATENLTILSLNGVGVALMIVFSYIGNNMSTRLRIRTDLLKALKIKDPNVNTLLREIVNNDYDTWHLIKTTELKNADLRFTDFHQIDLKFADLSGADLEEVDFSGANLQNAKAYKFQREDFKKAGVKEEMLNNIDWIEDTERARAHHEKRMKILKDLHPYFSEGQALRAYQLYIETQAQNVPPSRELEPSFTHKFVAREPLIPKLLKDAFSGLKNADRFSLVLADSGMGKTTFMINLYLRYIETTKGEEYDIKLFPLGYPGVEDKIQEMVKNGKDKDTILLLDAFNEDPEAAQDYKKRMDDIIHLVRNFRVIVITSRTQFFPNEDALPGEINVPNQNPSKPGFHKFKVMYISPFSDEDIDTYLDKKFVENTPESKENKRKAQQIVKRSPSLMVRPMLLANIDDLLKDSERTYAYTYEIYEVLIDKWLDREASRKPQAERGHFRAELFRFSHKIALKIYEDWKKEKRLHIPKIDLGVFAEKQNIQLENIDLTSRSLLNRDAIGNWKFSHKSILEYFLAQEARRNLNFFQTFDFSGMDMVKQFLREYGLIPEMIRAKEGSFIRGKYKVTVSSFEIGKYPITQAQWEAVMGDNPSHFKGEPHAPVENVSWKDVQSFIQKLNKQTGYTYRLPTEAEWEFAARGGTWTKGYEYAGSDKLDKVGWYDQNSNSNTHPVGQKKPNELGLYDMSGNVWEWCQDWYGDYPSEAQIDPQGPKSGVVRVIRGGSWSFDASRCRVANRYYYHPSYRDGSVGFRLARTVSF